MTDDGPAHRGTHESNVPRIPTYAETEANPQLLTDFNAAVVEEFRSNHGRVGGPFADSDVVLLTMTGAKSGRRRQTPLEYFIVDGRILVVGTKGGAPQHPAWVHNLRAHPHAHIEIGEDSYDVVAHEISGDERDTAFARIVEICPRIDTYPKTCRVIPVFELSRTTPADR
ncbi:nitroreductase/quinone reductase family protein [Mycobacterium sp. NPDC003449]